MVALRERQQLLHPGSSPKPWEWRVLVGNGKGLILNKDSLKGGRRPCYGFHGAGPISGEKVFSLVGAWKDPKIPATITGCFALKRIFTEN